MSNGHEKPQEKVIITMDPEEFNEVVKRVHSFLLNRVEKAKEKKDAKPSERSSEKHIEAAKDVFVFVHMMQLIEQMSEEISDLRDIIESVGNQEQRSNVSSFETFSTPKKTYWN